MSRGNRARPHVKRLGRVRRKRAFLRMKKLRRRMRIFRVVQRRINRRRRR